MEKIKKIIVSKTHAGERLDIFVAEKLKTTRSQIEKLLKQNRITLNGALPKKGGQVVRGGDMVEIAEQHKSRTVQHSPNNGAIEQLDNQSSEKIKRLEDYKITVISETPNYVIVNKPTGLLVHETQAHEKNTLVAWLIKKYPKIKTVGDSPLLTPATAGSRLFKIGAVRDKEGRGVVAEAKTFRPGIVHRLDKEASGLMVVAKTQPMFDHLKDQFKNRTVEKEYWALVHGKVAKDWDEVNFPIARSENADRMAARPLLSAVRTTANPSAPPLGKGRTTSPSFEEGDHGGVAAAKDARTEFLVEKRFVNFSLLRVTLHTGRMHQIRAHMLAYNHPLVGDPLYFQKKRPRKWDEKLGRLFLHSTKLSFSDLNGQKQVFQSELPTQLTEFLTQLK